MAIRHTPFLDEVDDHMAHGRSVKATGAGILPGGKADPIDRENERLAKWAAEILSRAGGNRIVTSIQRSLGLPRFGMHSFRHYSVSYCVRHGMSFDDVRMRHGHGSEEIMRMYLHLAPGHDARTLRMIPNIAAELGPKVGPSKVVQLRQAV